MAGLCNICTSCNRDCHSRIILLSHSRACRHWCADRRLSKTRVPSDSSLIFYMWSRLDHDWSNKCQQDRCSGCLLKHFLLVNYTCKTTSECNFFLLNWPQIVCIVCKCWLGSNHHYTGLEKSAALASRFSSWASFLFILTCPKGADKSCGN